MKVFLRFPMLFLLLLILTGCNTEPAVVSSWHHPLYMDNCDFWRQRIPVIIKNNSSLDLWGDPVVIDVGRGKKHLPLKGIRAESVRLTNSVGKQLLYRISGPNGVQIEKGPIPAKSSISIPLECDAGQEYTALVYYDNPSAWPVGEYFNTHREIQNGGFEMSRAFGPLNWELEWPQEERDKEFFDLEGLHHKVKVFVKLT